MNASILTRQPKPIHAAKIVGVCGLAFAIDDELPAFGELDGRAADRRHQPMPIAIGAKGVGNFRRAQRLGIRFREDIKNLLRKRMFVTRFRIEICHLHAMTHRSPRCKPRVYRAIARHASDANCLRHITMTMAVVVANKTHGLMNQPR